MKKLLFILFALMFSLPCEASLSHNTHLTHTGLKPVPNSFQVAKSHFLPEYQTGAMDFVDNSNSTDYCPVSLYKYTAADCPAPKVTANHCPGTDRYSQCNCPGTYVSEEDCTAQGKVTDGTVCNGDNGTKYPACKCPDNYGEVTADKNCSVSICRHQGVSYCPPSALSCKNSFKLCGSGMIAASGASACTDNQGTKYSACSCDTSVYGKTDDICQREFGKNAAVSGTSCNDERGSYGTSCSCTPDSLSNEYSKSCGSQGYSETIDDGCGGTYYICNTLPVSPSVGDIYYSDGSYSADYNQSKTAIGVVIDSTRQLLIDLRGANQYWNDGTENFKHISTMSLFGAGNDDDAVARTDMNGEANTNKIISWAESSKQRHYAAEYCAAKSAGGIKWFLPSAGQLYLFYKNQSAIQAGLNKIPAAEMLSTSKKYWSSTLGASTVWQYAFAWTLVFSSGDLYQAYKNYNDKNVRCVAVYTTISNIGTPD